MKDEDIARACHNIDAALCVANGDLSAANFDSIDAESKKSAIDFVATVRSLINRPKKKKGKGVVPEKSQCQLLHESYVAARQKEGWSHGNLYDGKKKQSPLLKAYSQLRAFDRARMDVWYSAIADLVKVQEKVLDEIKEIESEYEQKLAELKEVTQEK